MVRINLFDVIPSLFLGPTFEPSSLLARARAVGPVILRAGVP
ncbi:MAG: hypothetical protein ACU0BS_09780 [Hasllibacter sp.]